MSAMSWPWAWSVGNLDEEEVLPSEKAADVSEICKVRVSNGTHNLWANHPEHPRVFQWIKPLGPLSLDLHWMAGLQVETQMLCIKRYPQAADFARSLRNMTPSRTAGGEETRCI